jgi:hypothetical protein
MRVLHLSRALWLAAAACADNTGLDTPRDGAIVTFAFEASADTLRVHVRDSATIARAEARVATGQGPRMPVGPIVRGAGVDARYPFHYLADDVRLNDLAMEVCDGRPMRTPQEVTTFFALATGDANASRATWCPWGASPIAVERLPFAASR